MEEQSCANMSLFLLRNYALSDLMAMAIGHDNNVSIEEQSLFLITGLVGVVKNMTRTPTIVTSRRISSPSRRRPSRYS